MMFRREFFTVLAVCVLATPVSASTVNYWIDSPGAGAWDLWTQEVADGGENLFGLAQFAVEVLGADSIQHVSPFGAFSQATGTPIGFNFARSADDATVVSAAQDVTSNTFAPVIGFGVSAGSLPGPIFGASSQVDYGVPLLLATGAFTQEALPTLGQLDGLVCGDGACGEFARPLGGFVHGPPDMGPTNMPPVGIDASVDTFVGQFVQQVVNHNFMANDDGLPEPPALSWSDLVFDGPTAASLNAAGAFSWDVVGAAPAVYTATATVSDGDLTGTASLTINVAVPEPGTVALASLALVGLVGFIRRRK